jgi:hypothetical protein
MEAVLQYVDACNIGDPVAMAATCADTMQILDGMSRHVWQGPSAAEDWWRDVLSESDRIGASGYHNTSGSHVMSMSRVITGMSWFPRICRLNLRENDRNGHWWYLALSGLRRSDIAGLKWSDVDLDAGTITRATEPTRGGHRGRERPKGSVVVSHAAPRQGGLVSVLEPVSVHYAHERLSWGRQTRTAVTW